jgi:hypothetical protein
MTAHIIGWALFTTIVLLIAVRAIAATWFLLIFRGPSSADPAARDGATVLRWTAVTMILTGLPLLAESLTAPPIGYSNLPNIVSVFLANIVQTVFSVWMLRTFLQYR